MSRGLLRGSDRNEKFRFTYLFHEEDLRRIDGKCRDALSVPLPLTKIPVPIFRDRDTYVSSPLYATKGQESGTNEEMIHPEI